MKNGTAMVMMMTMIIKKMAKYSDERTLFSKFDALFKTGIFTKSFYAKQ